MKCKNFNLYESIRLKSNNKIPKIKLTLMLFLVCLLDVVYSNKMLTSKSGKALTAMNPENVGLSNRFLESLLGFSNLIKVDINSPHDNNGDNSRIKYPRFEKPLHVEGPYYPKPYDGKPNYPNTIFEGLYYPKSIDGNPKYPNSFIEGQYYPNSENEKRYNTKPDNEGQFHQKPNNGLPYYPKPDNNIPQYPYNINERPYYPKLENEKQYNTKPDNEGQFYQKPNIEETYYHKPDDIPQCPNSINEIPYYLKPENKKRNNTKPDNEGQFHQKPNSEEPYYPKPDDIPPCQKNDVKPCPSKSHEEKGILQYILQLLEPKIVKIFHN